MTWGAIGGAAVGVVGSALVNRGGSQTNGGAGTQTQTKEPWLQAQPWIMNNLQQGQALQNAYTAQPFSALQNQAYQNQANQSAYMRGVVPSLLGQISGQQVGFDRSNPNARPTAFDFNKAMDAGNQGLLSMLNSQPTQAVNLNANTPAAAAPAQQQSTFKNLDVGNPLNAYYGQLLQQNGVGADAGNGIAAGIAGGWNTDFMRAANGAGYGTFKYGQAMPMPGTQQYRDMQEYLQYGGADPYGLYTGRGAGALGAAGGSSVGIDGIGVAGSDSAVGSSANF